jgi:hypothetical protein
MTYKERSKEVSGEADKPYEPPRLTLVGNLNDLLAGSGSKDTDNPPTCPAVGVINSGCAN